MSYKTYVQSLNKKAVFSYPLTKVSIFIQEKAIAYEVITLTVKL